MSLPAVVFKFINGESSNCILKFKCHFRQLYFKTEQLNIPFLFILPLPFRAFVPTSAENVSLLTGLPGAKMHMAVMSDDNMVETEREREVLKQLKKILAQPQSLASIRLVLADVAACVGATEFWQRWRSQPPSFTTAQLPNGSYSTAVIYSLPWQPNNLL